jgi:hypothetical protein
VGRCGRAAKELVVARRDAEVHPLGLRLSHRSTVYTDCAYKSMGLFFPHPFPQRPSRAKSRWK